MLNFPINAIVVLFKGENIKIKIKKIDSTTNKDMFLELFT
jgi:hypothetical protein